jgi:hypothetical protein
MRHGPRYTFTMNRPPQATARCGAKTSLAGRQGLLVLLALITLALCPMTLCPIVQASTPDTMLTRLLACRAIVPNATRLTCFDRTSAALASAAASAPTKAPGSATRAMTEALDPERTFGLPHATIVQREAAAAGVRVKETSSLSARIVRMGQGPDGRAIFDLDNGQIWEQLVPDGTDIGAKPGDSVRISRGWLSSYWLEAPSHHGYKVTRLR